MCVVAPQGGWDTFGAADTISLTLETNKHRRREGAPPQWPEAHRSTLYQVVSVIVALGNARLPPLTVSLHAYVAGPVGARA